MEILGEVGAVTGVGGIALVVVVLVFRDVISRSIFPKLTREQSFRLLMTMVLSISVIAIGGLGTYAAVELADDGPSTAGAGTSTAAPGNGTLNTTTPGTPTSTPTPVPTVATPIPPVTTTPGVAPPCELSGTVFGSDNKALPAVAVGYSRAPDWVVLAVTETGGRFKGSCLLGVKDFPIDLEVTTATDKCVRKAQVTLPEPGTYGSLNLRVQTTCLKRVDIAIDISQLKPGAIKVAP